jgi:hypothetical protein
MKKYLLLLILFFPLTIFATSAAKDEIQRVGHQWTLALSSEKPAKIAALYDRNAFLYATFVDYIHTHQGITDYFRQLMRNKDLKVRFVQQNIRIYDHTAVNSGLYVFSYHKNGKVISIPARYTFVYVLEPKGWMIVDHHSSILPKK